MATKKIIDLSLRTDFDETCNVPLDDATQSWRATGQQILNFILKKFNTALSKTDADTGYSLAFGINVVEWDLTSGAASMVIPAAASGNAGQTCWIRKTDSSFNALTLGTGLSTTLNTQGEAVLIYSNGTNWRVLQRYIPSGWNSYTPVCGLTGGVTTPYALWKREGDSIRVKIDAIFGTIFTGGAATFTLPSGLTFNTSKIPGTPVPTAAPEVGIASFFDVGSDVYYGRVFYNSDTEVIARLFADDAGPAGGSVATGTVSTTLPFTWANNDRMAIEFTTPITGWNG